MKSVLFCLVPVVVAVCFGSRLAQCEDDDKRVPVGFYMQLLVDDYTVAEKNNLRRVQGSVTKANGGRPVMVADKPWESGRWGLFGFYGTVLHDSEKFQMWHNPWRFAIAYAESTDGVHWDKPKLDLYDFSVERANKETQLDHNSGFYPREDVKRDYHGNFLTAVYMPVRIRQATM